MQLTGGCFTFKGWGGVGGGSEQALYAWYKRRTTASTASSHIGTDGVVSFPSPPSLMSFGFREVPYHTKALIVHDTNHIIYCMLYSYIYI